MRIPLPSRALMLLALAVLAPVAATAQPAAPPSQDPAVVAPQTYKVTLDNERVRVFDVTFKRGATVAMHAHPDHVAYAISGGKLEFTLADGTQRVVEAKAGETFFIPAQAHSSKNIGSGTVRVVVTELKDAPRSGKLDEAERQQLLELYQRGQDELEELVAATPDELWATKPAADRWSVAEVVEHLGASESLLFGFVQQALGSPENKDWALVEGKMAPGNFLAMLQDRSKKFQAPEPLQPQGGLSRADALAKFAGARAVTAEFVRRTDLAVKKHVADGPTGNMTVHQLLVLMGGHNLRHNAQIREALEQLKKK
jgi:beta-alanine degradation protein BauB